nr:class E sortase [Motilibacter deserti]
MLLGFGLQLGVVGAVQHDRDQEVAYDDFRGALALALAPVGQADYEGKLLQPGAAVAILEIPRLGLREVVGEGTTSEVLQSGPGHRRDTVLPGQAGTSVVFGRRAGYGGPFSGIAGLRIGDAIRTTTGQGEATFRVLGVRRAGDPVLAPLAPGAGRLTLVTADGDAFFPQGALRVDAELTSAAFPAPAKVVTAADLGASEQPLAGDSKAWVPLVLWGEGLLLAAVGFVWARARWGRWQAWIAGGPALVALALPVADCTSRLLPNLL